MQEYFEFEKFNTNFDFRGFVLKLLSFWPVFLISLGLALGIAYYINVRKLAEYQISSLISVKDNNNPFFTSNTSLTFNWGGTTDKINTAIVTLRSRSHNEKVVQQLQFFKEYLIQGKYQLENAYKKTPFTVVADTLKPQILNHLIEIQVVDEEFFIMRSDFPESSYQTQEYTHKVIERITLPEDRYEGQFKFGEKIALPFFNGVIYRSDRPINTQPYFIRFLNFDSRVAQFRRIRVQPESQGSSVL